MEPFGCVDFEIGRLDARFEQNLIQRPLRDQFSRIHHYDAIGDGVEQLHAMLDQYDRDV